MTEEEKVCDICANISLKRMYLLLLEAQEIILEDNPKYRKKEILTLLSSVIHDVKMLDDKNNRISRDLFE